jgi:hypothetical protein
MPACTGGPMMDRGGNQRGEKPYYPVRDYIAVSSYAGNEDFRTLLKKPRIYDRKSKIPPPLPGAGRRQGP